MEAIKELALATAVFLAGLACLATAAAGLVAFTKLLKSTFFD